MHAVTIFVSFSTATIVHFLGRYREHVGIRTTTRSIAIINFFSSRYRPKLTLQQHRNPIFNRGWLENKRSLFIWEPTQLLQIHVTDMLCKYPDKYTVLNRANRWILRGERFPRQSSKWLESDELFLQTSLRGAPPRMH